MVADSHSVPLGTGRSWTRIGTLGSGARPVVDRRGLLTPRAGGWSLDWWIGAEDRWHIPSREGAVRQRLVDGAPVVETSLRVPGGDAVERLYAWESGLHGPEVIVEIDNRSPVPFAVALAVRPVSATGVPAVHRLELRGSVLWVNGRIGVVMAAAPRHAVLSTRQGGDALDVLLSTTPASSPAGADAGGSVEDPEGWATAALIMPVAHRTLMRAVVPLSGEASRTGGFSAAALPSAATVASGWNRRVAEGGRIEWPAGPLADAMLAQRSHLQLAAWPDGDQDRGHGSSCGPPGVADAVVAGALVTTGAGKDAGQLLARWLKDQAADGGLGEGTGATGAVLWAWELHAALAREPLAREPLAREPLGGLVTDPAATVAAAAEVLARSPARVHANESAMASEAWYVAGLVAAARLLGALGERRASRSARSWAEQRLGWLLAASDPVECLQAADLGLISARQVAIPDWGQAVPGCPHPDTHPGLALLAARVALRTGHPAGVRGLERVLRAASPTWTWPDGGDGHSAVAAAGMWALGRDLLVRDQEGADGQQDGHAGPRTVSVCTWWPEEWRGQEAEVHGLPTSFGRLSYALRWHGRRPALLWELTDVTADGDIRWLAPGLDRNWSGTGRRGEALLAPSP